MQPSVPGKAQVAGDGKAQLFHPAIVSQRSFLTVLRIRTYVILRQGVTQFQRDDHVVLRSGDARTLAVEPVERTGQTTIQQAEVRTDVGVLILHPGYSSIRSTPVTAGGNGSPIQDRRSQQ